MGSLPHPRACLSLKAAPATRLSSQGPMQPFSSPLLPQPVRSQHSERGLVISRPLTPQPALLGLALPAVDIGEPPRILFSQDIPLLKPCLEVPLLQLRGVVLPLVLRAGGAQGIILGSRGRLSQVRRDLQPLC